MDAEIGGLVFTYDETEHTFEVVDISYGYRIGSFRLDEGPGWIVDLDHHCGFLDSGQLSVLANFANALNKEL